MDLRENSQYIQKVVEVISSVLEVDVTIVDHELVRIAATGEYIDRIGENIAGSSAFSKTMNEKEYIIIDDTSKNRQCTACKYYGICNEYALMCFPIIYKENCIGVIGLIAFSERQRNIIENKKQYLISFINNMSDLIILKAIQKDTSNRLTLLTKQLQAIINSCENGIILVNSNGVILKYNTSAKEKIGLTEDDINNVNIETLLPAINAREILKQGLNIRNREFIYKKNKKCIRGIYNAELVGDEGETKGLVIIFKFIKEIIEAYNVVTNDLSTIGFKDILGESPSIVETKKIALKASQSSSTILITGESGTGKDLFARAIHSNSDRRNNPFIAVNCAAIPENLLESELFGYENGAFTGAKRGGKIGKFELANTGTIFLDEIGDLKLNLQAKLLRVIQEREVERIGGNSPIPLDIRIIAATNKNLEKKVANGEFREDLYYRLNVIPIYIEPLRNRVEDIEELSRFLLKKYALKLDKEVSGFTEEVMDIFRNYKWPGNVRELENIIEYSINMATENMITIKNLPEQFKSTKVQDQNFKIRTLKEIEKEEIEKAIKKYGMDKIGMKEITESLGVSRATIYRKIREYKIET